MSKEDKIGVRIEVLREKLGNLSIAALEKGRFEDEKRLLGNGTISDWIDRELDWTSDKLEKFLKHWNVNRDWWASGEGDIFNKNGTYVDIPSDNKEKQPPVRDTVYQTIVEGHTEYVLIPRSIMKETQLISSEQIKRTWDELAEKNKELERKNKQIEFYQQQIARLLNGVELSNKLAEAKKV